jgi:putative peptidoglycan lipid II flippase
MYQRGAFDSAATQTTASILGWYALSLPAISGLMIVNSIYCSLGKPSTLVSLYLFNWIATLGLGLVLVKSYGPSGIALSISLATTLVCILALWMLKRRLPTLRMRILGESVFKALAAAGTMAISLLGLKALAAGTFITGVIPAIQLLLTLLSVAMLGGMVYGSIALVLRMEEALDIVQAILHFARQRG